MVDKCEGDMADARRDTCAHRMPVLSVVVPVFNVARYLDKCLDSILVQRPGHLEVEVIAVDDASTDASPTILDTYAAAYPRLRVVTLQRNGGLAHARNSGLDAASGDYVMFVDSDDWLADGTFDAIGAQLRRRPVDVLFYGHERVADDGSVLPVPDHGLAALATLDSFTLAEHPQAIRLFHVAWNKVYDRQFLGATGLRFMDGYYEDLPLTYPALMLAERIAALDRVCYFYRERPGAITSTPGPRHFEVFAKYERIFAFIAARPQLEVYRQLIFERMVTHELGIMARAGTGVLTSGRRDFFHRVAAHYRRFRPRGYVPPPGVASVKHRLLQHDAYGTFHVLMMLYRAFQPLRAGGRPVVEERRLGAPPAPVSAPALRGDY